MSARSLGPLPYYRWLVRDYRSNRKVQRMGYIAKGLYRELLDEQWLEGSLSKDIVDLADICNCPVEVMQSHWPEIAPCFQEVDGRLVNAKLEGMRTEVDACRVKRIESGRMGGFAKQSMASAKQMPDDTKEVPGQAKHVPYSRAEQEESREDSPPPRAMHERDYEPESGEIPEGLPTLQYARGLMEQCNLPESFSTQQAVSAAIGAYAREHSISPAKSTQALIAEAQRAMQRGEPVNKFWFEDAKWRRASGGSGSTKPSGTQERVNGNIAALRAAAERAGHRAPAGDARADVGPVAFANMLDYLEISPDGVATINLSKLTRDQAAAILEVTVEEYVERNGDQTERVKRTKFKLGDKRGSLDLLGRHLKLFTDNVNLKLGDTDGAAILEKLLS